MNKDELLKIYSAYLPYKTPITLASEAYNYDGLTTILSPHYLLDWQRNKCKISLHLWDLSYLTKEIEHEGNMKILSKELFAGKWKEITEYYVNTGQLLSLSYNCVQELLKHHFNVFQLPKDLFINKANLKQ